MVNALEYTSRGDSEDITIMIGGSKQGKLKKKYITDVIRESKELNEYGVYNSETDVNSNVKTKENEPSNTQEFLEKLKETIKGAVGTLAEIKKTVEDNSKISFDSLDICIAELETYTKSIDEELETIGSANT